MSGSLPRRRASDGKSKVERIAALIAFVVVLVGAGVIFGPKLLKGGMSSGALATPDGTFLAVAKGLANHDAGVLWDAVPVSYQRDVNSLVHEFAETMEPQVWDRSFALANRLVGMLKSKKQFIFANPRFASLPDKGKVMKHYDSALDLMDVFLKSDLSKLDNLKQLDVGDYLDTTGSKMLKEISLLIEAASGGNGTNVIRELSKMTATVVKSGDQTATLEIAFPNQPPKQIDCVRIEERWIPREMAEGWPRMIETARQKLANLKKNPDASAMQVNMVFGMAEGMLAQFENANSQEEFDAAVQGIMGMAGANAAANPGFVNAEPTPGDQPRGAEGLGLGMKFPNFAEKDINGKPMSLAAYRGKVVLVDFWATWCGPCRAELPNVIGIYRDYHAQGFEILGVNLDRTRGKLTSFTRSQGMTWPQYFDGQGWRNKLAVKYQVRAIPMTYLLDRQGVIIGKGLRGKKLADAVARAVADK